jgi:hypothetical protein
MGLDVLAVLILKNISILLLFNNADDDAFKILPTFSHINFTELLHSFSKLSTFDVIVHNIIIV